MALQSFGNILEIARQRPDATRVAGLYAWNQLGRKVMKGQKGIRILAPMIGTKRKKDSEADKDKNPNPRWRKLAKPFPSPFRADGIGPSVRRGEATNAVPRPLFGRQGETLPVSPCTLFRPFAGSVPSPAPLPGHHTKRQKSYVSRPS